MTQTDQIEPQRRTDKWQLGAGGTSYAPEHPQHLHVPGFWDEVRMAGKAYSKLLCVSFVLERGGQLIELFPYLSFWYWHPDRIEARYYLVVREGIGYKQQAGIRVFLDEVRRVLPDGSLSCEFSFDLLKQHPPELHVVAWGVNSQLTSPAGQEPQSYGSAPLPDPVVAQLVHTPFWEQLRHGDLNEADHQSGALNALHWKVQLNADVPVQLQVNCRPFAPSL